MAFLKLGPMKNLSKKVGAGTAGYLGSNVAGNVIAAKVAIPGGKITLAAVKIAGALIGYSKAKSETMKAVFLGIGISGGSDVVKMVATKATPTLAPLLGMDMNSYNRNLIVNGDRLARSPATRKLLDRAPVMRGNRMGMDLSPGTRDFVMAGDRDPFVSQLPM